MVVRQVSSSMTLGVGRKPLALGSAASFCLELMSLLKGTCTSKQCTLVDEHASMPDPGSHPVPQPHGEHAETVLVFCMQARFIMSAT